MTKLKTIMVMNGAKGLLLDLLATRYYVEEQEVRILRCVKDLSDCVKKSDENVTQKDLYNIDDMQTEIDRLREALEEIKTVSELLNYDGIACVCNKALNGESEGKC